jgi:cysteinyl-tRNA synthetase
MSKSLGNSLLVSEVVQRVRPVELRYYLGAAHYRSAIEFSEDALQEAGASYRRIEGFLTRAVERLGSAPEPGELPKQFVDAMDDDLGVPQALAVVHDTVRAGNKALAAGDDDAVSAAAAGVRAMTGVLGLDPLAWGASTGESAELRGAVDALVAVALQARTDARERKDYAAADAVRDQLAAAGVVVEDTPTGPRWSLREDH